MNVVSPSGASAPLRLLIMLIALLAGSAALAGHTAAPASVSVPGSFNEEVGCPGDWQPECGVIDLVPVGAVWRGSFDIPAGDWFYKIAINDSWGENYGLGGRRDGDNIPLSLAEATTVTFTYDPVTHEISDSVNINVQPDAVTIAGSFQQELGCPDDWQPWCTITGLSFDPDDLVWQGTFTIPAENWFYKAALNLDWAESYGVNTGSGDIPLNLAAPTDVKFYFSNRTKWVADNVNKVIAVAPGNFQSELGCPDDWQPWCLRSWLQDPDGDGIYTFQTRDIPAGNYEVKVALNESWDLNYGEGGAQNGANIGFNVPSDGSLIVFTYDPSTNILDVGGELPVGNVSEASAYWLSEDTLAWNVPAGSEVSLHYSNDGSLATTPDGLVGEDGEIALMPAGVVDGAIAEKFRHLAGLPAFRIDGADADMLLKQQLALEARDGSGTPIDATAIQTAGVLDDLYTYDGELGVSYDGHRPTIRVWAPTARSVKLHLFGDSTGTASAVLPMENSNGTWSIEGDASWDRMYYLFEVEVFVRTTGNVETNLVTDPNSLSLSMNSRRSQIVNLDDDDLKPRRWDRLRKPRVRAPEDIVLYELHVRDYSMHDPFVPEFMKGTFKAFALPFSRGARHLRQLSRAGLSHVHILPAFDCATIEEDKSLRVEPEGLEAFAPDSFEQQAAIDAVRDQDGFNWCYDPYHYTAPEGSYSTNPDGPQRILEFRQMVAGLNRLGLRTVMDVVYNHTSGSGQGEKSVLDRIVPDYYHRLNGDGYIETSSCCANTASEHNMMEKLMLDSLKTWATAYKVDGFRFDLMGHHTKANIEKARDMLQSLSRRKDGVNGREIYIYGEGWNFGEVANDARFVQATQFNMGEGTGVGTFNDRMRDAVRGGGPFDTGEDHVRRQGFMNGLYFDPNYLNSGSGFELDELMKLTDWIRIGLTGSVENYQFVDRNGNLATSGTYEYFFGAGAGYTSDPQEAINYIAAHDNETLFDINQYKLPVGVTADDRVRVQNLGNSIIALSQGIPFFHAGQDILRSKSMDRNSFNSGDWFNVLDFTNRTNGWARGMPPQGDNAANAGVVQPMLADASRGVDRRDMRSANRHMKEMLRIRASSRLFRLRTEQAIRESVEFHNTGVGQIPGLIVMSLRGDDDIEIVVLFNANPGGQSFFLDAGEDGEFELHEVLEDSHDPVVRQSWYDEDEKTFYVPGRTTAVFVADD